MLEMLRSMGVWLGTGPLALMATVLGILTTIAALTIIVMEMSGRTISGRRIVRNNLKLDLTTFLIVIITTIFVVVISDVRFDFIHILNKGPRVAPALAPVLAVVFGLPGVLGFMLAVLVKNLQSGISAEALFTAV